MSFCTDCAVVVLLTLAAGCSASGDEIYEEVQSDEEALAGNELARIKFSDGNVVRFEELAGGVLVSEVGANVNSSHLAMSSDVERTDGVGGL